MRPGSCWIDNNLNTLSWIAHQFAQRYDHLGSYITFVGNTRNGSIWVNSSQVHYVDAAGVWRTCVGNAVSTTMVPPSQYANAVKGSIWIQNDGLYYIDDYTVLRRIS